MSASVVVACVQNRAVSDMDRSIDRAEALVREAAAAGARFIATPEFFSCLHIDDDGVQTGPLPEIEHPALERFASVARNTGAWILLGSLAIREGQHHRNRSLLLDDRGRVVARYDKIHLFNVDLGASERYRESDHFDPGNRAVIAATPWGPVGMTVCYDLRFAYLYRALAQGGATILTCPAAFTHTTGQAHWHVLARARAIETGSFVIAPCQNGYHGEGRSYGHSLIVDPWGEVLAEGDGDEEDVVLATLDPDRVDAARGRIPALAHDRCFTPP